jgi:hypothetical protein
MNILPKNSTARTLIWVSILFASLLLYWNQKVLFVYYNYAWYKLNDSAHETHDAVSDLSRTIDAAKEAGYSCKNKQSIGTVAYQEVTRRRKGLFRSYPSAIVDCVTLPTGEIIIHMNDGLARDYIQLKVNVSAPSGYQILDVRGEMLG